MVSIKQMGIISNILSRVYVHALRTGAARDIAHLPTADSAGFTTMQVAQSLRHSNNTFQAGITAKYVGEPSRETYNDRAERKYESIWGPKFSETSGHEIIKRRVTGLEIEEWLRLNQPDSESLDDVHLKRARARATKAIHSERQEDFIKTAKPEKKKKKGRALSQRSASEVNAISSTSKQPEAPKSGGNAAMEEELPTPRVDDTSMIDPRLLDETALTNMEIEAHDLRALEKQVLMPRADPDTSTEDDDLAATQSLFDGLATTGSADSHGTSQQLLSPADFILKYSKINIVNKSRFDKEWAHYQAGASFEESIGKLSVIGNSRDPPTPMEHQCRKTLGCPFKAFRLDSVMKHEFRCSEALVEKAAARENPDKPFKCTRGDCDAEFNSDEALNKHIKNIHDFEPKPCPHGCDPEKIYTSEGSYRGHLSKSHDDSGRFPTQCLYPECSTPTEFDNVEKYSDHLTKIHELNTTEKRRPYLPERKAVEKMKRVWESPLCPVEDCKSKQKWFRKSRLSKHLVEAHGYDKKTADEMAEGTGYVTKLVTSGYGMSKRAQGKNASSKRTLEIEDGGNVDDESDDEDEGGFVARKKGRKV